MLVTELAWWQACSRRMWLAAILSLIDIVLTGLIVYITAYHTGTDFKSVRHIA